MTADYNLVLTDYNAGLAHRHRNAIRVALETMTLIQSGELVTRCRAHPEETVKDWHERNISGEKFTEIAEKENKSKNTISGAVSRYRTKIRFYEETN